MKNWEFSLPEQDVDFIAAFPACEEEEGLDEGYGLIIEGGLSGQVGVGAEAGAQFDLGGNGRVGLGAKAKLTPGVGGGGNFYIGFGR